MAFETRASNKEGKKQKVINTEDTFHQLKKENVFCSTTNLDTITGSAEHDYVFIRNPGSSESKIVMKKLRLSCRSNGAVSIFRLYKGPTDTANGTNLAENNLNFKSGAAAAELRTYKNPTMTAKGTLIHMFIVEAAKTEEFEVNFRFPKNTKLLLTVKNSGTNQKVGAEIEWTEEK